MSGVNLKFKSDMNGSLMLETADGGMVTFRPDGTICVSSLAPIQIVGVKRHLLDTEFPREACGFSAKDVVMFDLERDLRKK